MYLILYQDKCYTSILQLVLAAQVLYLCIMVFTIYKEGRKIAADRQEYFSHIWNYYEVAWLIVSVVGIAMFAMKVTFFKVVLSQLEENKGK